LADVRPIEFRLLGPPEVVVDGRPVPIGSLQQRAILVALLLARDAVVPSSELADVVWGDHPPASAAKTLQGLVWRLRRQLPGVDVLGQDEGYRLVAGTEAVDARRFERLVTEGQRAAEQHKSEQATAAFEAALSLWRGPALGEFASWPFAQAEVARLDEARFGAIEDLAEAELALGRTASALARLEPLVQRWPLRERAVGHLMVALYRAGRQADALAAYQSLRRNLVEELGVEPTPALRDLDAAILCHSDELAPAGPLRSQARDVPRDNLPTSLNPFVGRATELGELSALLAENRLVTLTGPGGAGKTRLALEVARAVRDWFSDGVWLADLTVVADGAMVAPAIATGVGLLVGELAQPDRDLVANLTQRLRSRRHLLVLDNCEHVIDAAITAAHALLQTCPGLTILATSRESLSVTGEVVFSVPPLSLPSEDVGCADRSGGPESLLRFDAVALFCTRARAADRTFALSEANADPVVRICRRLDGLPLALELAAARARVLGAKELAQQLDNRFASLGEGPPTTPRRHQTLGAALDWSHGLLSHDEQAVFHRLAVFPGTFDLDAVRAVAGDDAIGLFLRLVDKSLVALVRDDSRIRYQLLESVRAYACDKLAAAGGFDRAQRSHRDAFLALAIAMVDDAEGWWDAGRFQRLHSDYPNFIGALEWSWASGDHDAVVWICAALTLYWDWSGYPEAYEWMERAVATPIPSPAMRRPAVLVRLALALLLRNVHGEVDGRAPALIAQALEIAEASGDPFARAMARIRAFEQAVITGHPEDAPEHLRQAEDAFQAFGPAMAALYETAWVQLALAAGDLDRAAQTLEGPLETLRTTTDHSYLLALAQGTAALLRARAGDRSALDLAAEALAATRHFPVPLAVVMALARAADAAVLLDRPDDARPLVVELVDILRQLGTRRWAAEAHELAAIVLSDDQRRSAAVALGAADRLRTELGEHPGAALPLTGALEAASDRISRALGPEEFRFHKEKGATLPVDEALAFVAAQLRHSG
jgi:predicted ATPase/DNA-binding SARP family transcriptional activator